MGGIRGAKWNLRSGAPQEVRDAGTRELETSALPPHNTYQAPGVKRAHDYKGVGLRRLVGFRLGSVVGL